MKKFSLLLAAATFAAFSGFAQNRAIKFETGSFADVLAKAKKENKPIMMDAYTTWCGPCKMMDKQVFTNDTVADFYNSNFIGYKVDMEKGEGPEIGKRYEVNAYPNFIFIAPDGSVLHRSVGARRPQDFVQVGKVALDPEKRYATLQKKYESGDRSPEFFANYVQTKGNLALDNSKEMKEYFATQKGAEITNRRNWKMISYYTRTTEAPEFKLLLNKRSDFAKVYTQDSVDHFILDIYNSELQRLINNNKTDKAQQIKNELAGMKLKDANRVIWSADAGMFEKKGDLQNYGATTAKVVEAYYLNDPFMLNNFSWTFYEKISDKNLLNKAASWSAKATQLEPSYANLDTHAAVLYKLGKKKEANAAAENAIATGKKAGEDVTETEALLKKINALK
jgi:thiol-disulfide isomerase/thioredoxin